MATGVTIAIFNDSSSIMNTKYLAVLLFIASAHATPLLDPLHQARDQCRIKCGLTPEQLRAGTNELETVVPYLMCLSSVFNLVKPDLTVDEGRTIQLLSSLIPITIGIPVMELCNNEIRKSGARNQVQSTLVWHRCVKTNLSPVIYQLSGVFGPPVYTR